MRPEEVDALVRLRQAKRDLTRQQLKTLQGLVFAGRPEAAVKGLQTILKRK